MPIVPPGLFRTNHLRTAASATATTTTTDDAPHTSFGTWWQLF
jgi:hypothetical protein